MSLLNRLERSLGRFALPNLSLWLVAGQFLFWGLTLLANFDVTRIALVPALVLEGEVWRTVTFLFYPPTLSRDVLSMVFLAFGWYMFHLMGSALEAYWGVFRYNLFILCGWALTVAASFLTPLYPAGNGFLAGTVFLAFAFLNPDFVIYVFFILPVKIKWLALLTWVLYGFSFVTGGWPTRLMVLAATGNFLLFFGRDLVQLARGGRRRMVQQGRAIAARNAAPEPRHTCHVCGKTDLTHPRLDFRYCSKCAGEECYCAEHIFNHVHTGAEPAVEKR